jgi:hypothetical protein
VLFLWAGDGPEKIVLVLVLDWDVSFCLPVLDHRPSLLLNDPTRGIDVGTKQESSHTSGPNSARWAVPGSRLLDADRAAI